MKPLARSNGIPRRGVLLLVPLAVSLCAAAPDKGKRAMVLVDRIYHETGFCYQARMDFGEEGDRDTRNTSGIRLFENGKELGPRAALHADIRAKGEGRYSHWVRGTLYFSTSDNSDPRTNGRTYEVVSANPDSALGGLRVRAGEVQRWVEVITDSAHAYSVTLGGDLDMDNTMTRSHDGITVAFQPNLRLTITNTGDSVVHWPKLVANGRGDWSTFDALLEDFTRGAANDQEKALCIWETMRQNRYHCLPLFPDDEFHDPVRMFNSYGLQLCDDMGYCGCSIFKRVGLGKPKYALDPAVYALHGHVQCEAVVDGRRQFLDIDQDVFYLDRECRQPVSGSEVARDHDLVRREVHYGPVFGNWNSSESAAALFGDDDTRSFKAVGGHSMEYALRPQERVEFRWDNVGKWVAHSEKWDRRPPFFGNSRFVYEPRLGPEHYREGIAEERDIVPATAPGAQLAGGSAEATLAYEIASPWAICGGQVRAEFVGLSDADRFAIDLVLAGKKPKRVWEGKGKGRVLCEASLDAALEPRVAPVHPQYRLVVSLASADGDHGANLASLRIATDIMAAPLSLPRLRLGENTFRYTDQEPGPHEIAITHEWQEVPGYQRPLPPSQPEYPPDSRTVRDSLLQFRWPETPKAGAYHLRVSTRKDFRYPYRPAYDVVIRSNTWLVPYTGMFAPGTDYYWRVRVRDKAGVWSDWGPTWTFRWQGPCVPLQVRCETTAKGILLHWEPNPRGERPVRYDVYGDDEKGFSVHKKPYQGYVRGDAPANYLGTTDGTSLLVCSPMPDHASMNRAYYRVVAVDAHGAESICSDFVELPRPHIWTEPAQVGKVGIPYRYLPQSIRSLGDVQHRYQTPNNRFWDEEKLSFSLAAGPKWLSCDAATGALAGTPDGPGTFPVQLVVKDQFDKMAAQRFAVVVRR